jgi:hypothetical protein
MAFTNYGTLKTSLANWLHRGDLTSLIPDFIALAEVRIADDVRSHFNTVVVSGTSVVQTIALPSDYVEARSLYVTQSGENRTISYVPPSKYGQMALPARDSVAYTILGTSILLAPNPTGNVDYTFSYYNKPTAMSSDSDAPTLLVASPGLYLYGALCEAAPYIKDDARVQVWEAKYAQELAWVNSSESGHANMRVRADQGV